MKKHTKIIIIQAIIVALIGIIIYIFYPKIEFNLNGNTIKFDSINADKIIISKNPDFSNSRYIDFSNEKNISLNLEPGTYYWKPDNGLISGLKHEFTIDSIVSLETNNTDNETNLVNVGNVKINVTKDNNGIVVGYVVLEPNESEKIENKGVYVGEQDG